MIAQSFFGRAMNRQADNRNYQISQVSSIVTCFGRSLADEVGTGVHDQISEVGIEGSWTASPRRG